jgi:hypothetical protein
VTSEAFPGERDVCDRCEQVFTREPHGCPLCTSPPVTDADLMVIAEAMDGLDDGMEIRGSDDRVRDAVRLSGGSEAAASLGAAITRLVIRARGY